MNEHPRRNAICAALQRCLHARRDVRKAMVHGAGAGTREEDVVVELVKADQTAKQIDTTLPKLLDGRTVGEILEGWLGPESRTKAGDHLPDRAEDERRRLFSATMAQAASHNRRTAIRAAAETPRENPDANDSTKSNGSKGDGGGDGTATRNPTADSTGKLTRRQMLDAGFTRQERATQYRKQRGPHPDDDTGAGLEPHGDGDSHSG